MLLTGWMSTIQGFPEDFARRTEEQFQACQQRFAQAPGEVEVAVEFARASFEWAEFASQDAARAEIARSGVAAARNALTLAPDLAAGHYYLAMNLGQLARSSRRLGALRLVEDMEQLFKRAAELDPKLDYGGPDRALGVLYRDAPGWPLSIGSRKNARRHLLKAAELAPDFPENRLILIESYLAWNELALARRELQLFEKDLPRSRSLFAGAEWERDWAGWQERLQELRQRLVGGSSNRRR
jgi:hypothetical protein